MSLTTVDVFSIISSVFSIVLGILAIALSIVFYKMSEKSARESERSANQIDANIKKLETLFDKLYSGTFDMMKETVTDMRKHVYSERGVTPLNEEVTKEIEKKTNDAISNVVQEIKNNQKSDEELESIILNVISNTKQLEQEVVTNALREMIIKYLKVNGNTPYKALKEHLLANSLLSSRKDSSLFKELESMVEEGIIENPFNFDDEIGNSISLNKKIVLK